MPGFYATAFDAGGFDIAPGAVSTMVWPVVVVVAAAGVAAGRLQRPRFRIRWRKYRRAA